MEEDIYRRIIDNYLSDRLDVIKFIDQFIHQWRRDKSAKVYNDLRFQRLVNRIFTSCDCYAENPENHFEINEKQLKEEVGLLRYIWYG